jgi:hypothetical protein
MANEDEKGPLLTDRQRRHLSGETGVEKGSAADRSERSRIRKRVKNGIIDFRFLFEHLDQADRDKILENNSFEQAKLHDGMVAVVALFYEMCDREGWPFQELLKRAVEDAHRDDRRTPARMGVNNVSFDKSLEPPRTKREVERTALLKYKRGDELTDREFRALVEPKGWITDPEAGLYLHRKEILETIRDRRKEQYQERRSKEIMDRINKEVEMFGEGYQVSPDFREEFLDDEE